MRRYDILIRRYSQLHFMCGLNFYKTDVKVWILYQVISKRWISDQLNTFFNIFVINFGWVCYVLHPANPPKSDDKYVERSVQLVRGSYFRKDLLQNPYFSKYKMEFTWMKKSNKFQKNTERTLIGRRILMFKFNLFCLKTLFCSLLNEKKKCDSKHPKF